MKHIYTMLILILFAFSGTMAQNPIVVSEDEFTFGNSTVPGYSVSIPEAEYDKTVKDWIKYLQSGTRSKVVEKGNNFSIFGAKVKPVSESPVNVYSIVTGDDGAVKIQAAFELERERYASSTEYANARKYLFDFAKDEYVAIVNGQLSAEEKILRSLKSELSSLQNEQSKIEKSTASGQETIEEESQRLAELNTRMAALSPQQYQGGDSAVITGMGAASPDEVKNLEKERKKLNREIKSAESKIDKAQKDIEKNERTLPGNLSGQETAKSKVEEQEKVVEFHRKKLETIKSYK